MRSRDTPQVIELKKQYKSEASAFHSAKCRCSIPTLRGYQDYGGRGIEFRFKSFQEFFDEVGPKPTPEHSLDRIDNNGHYEKGNIRWATRMEQGINTRKNHFITYNGKSLTLSQWSAITGLKSRKIIYRLNKGWCLDCVLSTTGVPCTHNYNGKELWIEARKNRKKNKRFTYNGLTLTYTQWSEKLGISRDTFKDRIERLHWCAHCIVTLPINGKCSHRLN